MEVVIEKAAAEPVEDVLTTVGSVEANERVELKPKAAGLIEAIHFVEGQRVKQGKIEVREGLSGGQPLGVSGTQKLVDGMKVIAAKTPATASSGKNP